jgi:hypothetical protein
MKFQLNSDLTFVFSLLGKYTSSEREETNGHEAQALTEWNGAVLTDEDGVLFFFIRRGTSHFHRGHPD